MAEFCGPGGVRGEKRSYDGEVYDVNYHAPRKQRLSRIGLSIQTRGSSCGRRIHRKHRCSYSFVYPPRPPAPLSYNDADFFDEFISPRSAETHRPAPLPPSTENWAVSLSLFLGSLERRVKPSLGIRSLISLLPAFNFIGIGLLPLCQ